MPHPQRTDIQPANPLEARIIESHGGRLWAVGPLASEL
jgi:hypothetical protein